jgi:hypothetical protein
VIPWATIDAALVVAVKAASGLTDVTWRWQPSAMRKPQYILLERSPATATGVDVRERKRDPLPRADLSTIVVRQHGWRTFSLELRCVSDVGKPSDTAPKDASDLLGLVQTRIRRPAVLDALRTAGVALSTIGPIFRQAYSVEGREMRASIMSLVFLTADCDEDGAGEAIEHVTGTVTVESPDESEVEIPISAP